MFRFSLVAVILFLFLTGASACRKDQPVQAPEPEDPEETCPGPTSPRDGGVLRVGIGRAPVRLNPAHTSSMTDIMLNALLYDGLVVHDSHMNLQPGLASSWEVHDGGTTWIFHLRQDVVFHSGNPFAAEDVKDHYERWQQAPAAPGLPNLDSIEVIDDHQVAFHLKYPGLAFLSTISLAHWGHGGIPEAEAVREWGSEYGLTAESVSGTGPFLVSEWSPGGPIILERNEHYVWGHPGQKNQGPAHLEGVEIFAFDSPAKRLEALLAGRLDLDLFVSPVEADAFMIRENVDLLAPPRISINHLGFSLAREPTQEMSFRLAVAHAVDQEEIIDRVWGGQATTNPGLWHPLMEGASPSGRLEGLCREADPHRAVSILREAGWETGQEGRLEREGDPLELSLYVDSGMGVRVGRVVQKQLERIGAAVEVHPVDDRALRSAVRQGHHHLVYMDGTAASSDVAYWFTTDSIPIPNYLYWSHDEYDRLFEVSQTTMDPARRARAFEEMEQLLLEEQVVIGMPHHTWLVGRAQHVHVESYHPVLGPFSLLDVWMEPDRDRSP